MVNGDTGISPFWQHGFEEIPVFLCLVQIFVTQLELLLLHWHTDRLRTYVTLIEFVNEWPTLKYP